MLRLFSLMLTTASCAKYAKSVCKARYTKCQGSLLLPMCLCCASCFIIGDACVSCVIIVYVWLLVFVCLLVWLFVCLFVCLLACLFIVAIFYPFSLFCEIGVAPLRLRKHTKTAPTSISEGGRIWQVCCLLVCCSSLVPHPQYMCIHK